MTRHSLLFWPVVLVLSAVACFPTGRGVTPSASRGCPCRPPTSMDGAHVSTLAMHWQDSSSSHLFPPETLSPWPAWVKRGKLPLYG